MKSLRLKSVTPFKLLEQLNLPTIPNSPTFMRKSPESNVMSIEHCSSVYHSIAAETEWKVFTSAPSVEGISLLGTQREYFKLPGAARRASKGHSKETSPDYRTELESLKVLLDNFKPKQTPAQRSSSHTRQRKTSPEIRPPSVCRLNSASGPSIKGSMTPTVMLDSTNLDLEGNSFGIDRLPKAQKPRRRKLNKTVVKKQFIVQLPRVKNFRSPHQ